MKTILYETVYSETTMSLDQLVNQRISDGWQPHGSPYINPSGTFFQAVVLDEDAAEKLRNDAQAEIKALLTEPGAKFTRL